MKTPQFWYEQKISIAAKLLAPLACVYETLAKIDKNLKTPQKISVPVICLGNIVAGGSGKTPCAIALSKILPFKSPAFVTRGYGGNNNIAQQVNSCEAKIWGDEALLLSNHAPTYVAHNRFKGAEMAIKNGADVIILDDGMQHYRLKKDITFCVIDGMMGFGNGKIIPAGPLRQSINDAAQAIDAFILIGDDIQNIKPKLPPNKPIFTAKLCVKPSFNYLNTEYIAFCGIGYPEKFWHTLNKHGVKVKKTHAFPDHHNYTNDDIDNLIKQAEQEKCRLITTEKDFVKISKTQNTKIIDVLPVEIKFDDPQNIVEFIYSK